ncbi:hypothetical protein PCK1_002582 [Pneumocystis canis]|nr:hypothetical protein PCK1_002582 [Pneumocystis canis]
MDAFHSTVGVPITPTSLASGVDTSKWVSVYHWPTTGYTVAPLHDTDIKWMHTGLHPLPANYSPDLGLHSTEASHVTHDAYTYTTWTPSNPPLPNVCGYSTTLPATLALPSTFNGTTPALTLPALTTTSIPSNSLSDWTTFTRKDKSIHHTVNSGPIPANPLRIYKDANGVDWISFAYSRERIRTEYTIRGDVETVDLDTLSEEFKHQNCIYPRARVPPEQYTGTRHRYETECNSIGWALATLNPCLRNKRGLIQRAVDSWRNKEPSLRSRRIRRMVALNDLHCTRNQDPPHETAATLSVVDSSSNVSPLPPQFRQLASTVACNIAFDPSHATLNDSTKKTSKSEDLPLKKPKYILLDDIKRGTRVRVRVNLNEVDLEEIPDAFRRDHCVFPHRFISIHSSYKNQEMEQVLSGEIESKSLFLDKRIFDDSKKSQCIYRKVWNQKGMNGDITEGSLLRPKRDQLSPEDDAKLVFGVLYSLKRISKKLAGPNESFLCYRTAEYKFHYYETASGLRFVLLTDPQCHHLLHVLHQIFISLYVEYVVKNSLGHPDYPKDDLHVELFELTLDQFIRSLKSNFFYITTIQTHFFNSEF